MTTHSSQDGPLPPLSRDPEPSPTTGDGSSLPLVEEVMDVAEMEPEGAPADDFEANARRNADGADDFSSDENPSLGPPDVQFDEIEDPDKGEDA